MIHPEFPELGDVVYLEHAHRGPLPERSRRAMERALGLSARGVPAKEELQTAAQEGCARLAAHILFVAHTTLRYTQNTTDALALVAGGIDWRDGDRVVTTAAEWPSAIEVWRRPGVKVDLVPTRPDADDRIDYDALRGALKGARVLSLGAVCLASGERRNLEMLSAWARQAGAIFVVDGAQAVGVLNLDPGTLDEIDALAGCTRKWLLGPPGGGFLYTRKDAPIALPPTGALAEPVWAGVSSSIEWLITVGGMPSTMKHIQEEALARADDLRARARRLGFEVRGDGPIVRVLGAKIADPQVIGRELPGEVRFSPHFWNSLADMERAAASLVRARTDS